MTANESQFDLVKAAEALLANAKKLAAEDDGGPDGDELRRSIAMAAKKIAFETAPAFDVVKSDWIVMADVAAWSLFLHWKAFDHIPLDGSSISVADLAKKLDAQESLVARLVNFLLSVGKLLPGSEPGHVRHSRVSKLYVSSHPVSSTATVAIGNGFKVYSRWPEYFDKYGRREPPSITHVPFSFAWGHPELAPWEVKALYPDYATEFTKSMKARQIVGGDMKLTGPEALYDFAWLGEEAKLRGKDEALVVDVGGGLGQLLKDVITTVPGVSASQCVLQDRKEVIEEATRVADPVLVDVVKMDHDFHTEQSVKGALVYLGRRILLDYPDSLAVGILRQLADALPVDNPKARIIIMEERLLDLPVPQNGIVDLVMLSIGGKLRNEKTMTELATAAGLKVIGYYTKPGVPTCAVECARA
ncbi:hypothetical protein OQA88_7455 [Cercophora sp. LCS_1]